MTFQNRRVPLLAALVLGAALVGCAPPPPPPPPPQPAPPPPPPPAVVVPVAVAKVDVDMMGAQLNIKTDIEFDTAKATIRDNPSSQTTLNAVLEILKKARRITKIRVEGHTDSDGNPADNEKLSLARAQAVVSWLAAHGIDPNRLSQAGCAARDPLAPNDTPANKQRNRRTEFDVEAIDGQHPDGYTEPCAPNKFARH